jgi:hypothetical protein
MQAEPLSPEALLHSLDEAARGLLFPSESDFPLTPFRWDSGPPSPEALRRAQCLDEDAPVEILTVEALFAPLVEPPEWSDAKARAEAERYRRLVELLQENLTDLCVYRVGRIEIDVYILGRHASGAWLGLKTKVVET